MKQPKDTDSSDGSEGFDWKKHKSAIIALCVVVGLVYYFGYMQPANIRSGCVAVAQNEAISMYQERHAAFPAAYPFTFGTTSTYNNADFQSQYRLCLEKNGLADPVTYQAAAQ